MEKLKLPKGKIMSKEDEDWEIASAGKQKKVDKETFKKLQKGFDIKQVMKEILIKKDLWVIKKESDVKQDYKFIKELGKGTYGNVFLAENKTTGEQRAIKEI